MLKHLEREQLAYEYYVNGVKYRLTISNSIISNDYNYHAVLKRIPTRGHPFGKTPTPYEWVILGESTEEIIANVDDFLNTKED